MKLRRTKTNWRTFKLKLDCVSLIKARRRNAMSKIEMSNASLNQRPLQHIGKNRTSKRTNPTLTTLASKNFTKKWNQIYNICGRIASNNFMNHANKYPWWCKSVLGCLFDMTNIDYAKCKEFKFVYYNNICNKQDIKIGNSNKSNQRVCQDT